MSRPKTEATIQRECDRSIRAERREQRRFVRETRQALRLKRQLTHESVVKNGIPKVQSGGTELGIHDAIAYSSLVICAGCAEAVREILDADGLCEKCKYEKEVESEKPTLMERGDKAVPGKGDGGNGTMALVGPL